MRLLVAACLGAGTLGLIATGFVALAAGTEMYRQCPHGADCPDARTVTAIALLGAVLCLALAWGAAMVFRRSPDARDRGR